MTIYKSDWELNMSRFLPDVTCPDCGMGYSVDDYPENCAMASVAIECEMCGYSLTLTMHHHPTFTMTYKYSKGDDPKELT